MAAGNKLSATPNEELEQLRKRLADAEDVLRAIHLGEVDGVVVEGAAGPQVFTLQTPDEPYRALVECMSEGAASISDKGIILFCNQSLADMVGWPLQKLMGSTADLLVISDDRERFRELLVRALESECQAEIKFDHKEGRTVPVKVSLREIPAAQIRSISLVATDLSVMRQAEETIRRHAGLVELAHDAMIFRQFDGGIVSWNRGAKDLYGWSAEEAIGKTTDELLQTKFPIPLDTLFATIRNSEEWEGELVQVCRNGEQITVASRWSLLRDEGRQPVLILEVNRDITERKQAEEELRANEKKYRALVETTDTGYVIIDAEGKVIDANAEYVRLTGRDSLAEIVGRRVSEWTSPNDIERNVEAVRQCAERGFVRNLELEYINPQGNRTPVEINATAVPTANEVRILSLCRNISERKCAEEALRQSEERLQLQIQRMPLACILWDRNFRVTSWNPAAEQIFGFKKEDALGRHPYEFIVPKSAQAPIDQVFQRLLQGDTTAHSTNENLTADGRVITCHWTNTPVKGTDGQTVAVLSMAEDITERKQAQEKVRLAGLYTRSLIEASLDPLVTISREGKITDVNEATEKATGLSRAQLVGSDFSDYFTEPEKARQGYERVFAEGTVWDYPLSLRSASGAVRDVLYNASVFRNEKGAVEGVFAAARDVTEIRKAHQEIRALNETLERRVRERTAELQAFFDTVPIGLAITNDSKGQHIRGNPAIEQILGASSGGELSRSSVDCAPYRILKDGQERPAEDLPMQRAARGETVAGELMDIVRADGKVITVHSVVAPLFDEQHRPRGAVGAFLDITESKRSQEALRESEELLRAVTDNSPDAIYVKDGLSRWLMANPAVLRIVGRTAEQALGKTDLELYADAAVGRAILENDRRIMEGGRTESFEEVADTPDGRRTFLSVKAPRRDAQGNIVGVIGISRDITERKRAEEALRESESRFRTLSNCVPDMVWTCTPDGKCDYVNSRYIEYTGIPVGGLLGFEWLKQVHPGDCERAIAEWKKTLEESVPYESDFRIRGRDGAFRYFKCRGSAVRDANGRVLKWFGTNTDIEDLRRFQQELTAANKELESFNYAVAHDLRAPLRHIHGFADLLTEEAAPVLNDSSKRHLRFIQESVDRMTGLLQDLLNLSRIGRQELRRQECDLNTLVRQVVTDVQPDVVERQIEWRIGDLPHVECDPTLMKQVLSNLLSNALKFTRERRPAVIEVGQTEQDGVPVIFIRDNGEGFDMKYADKLFGVFQRLHRQEEFEGTGVGLAIVQRIIHRHGGSVWAEAKLKHGATFYFSLQHCQIEDHKEVKTHASVA